MKEVSKIFSFADWNEDKKVSFLEFFSANVNFRASITEQHVAYAFELIDKNKDR